jgi:hypothetical protein
MPDYAWLVQYNPLAYIETTRYMLLNVIFIWDWVTLWGDRCL